MNQEIKKSVADIVSKDSPFSIRQSISICIDPYFRHSKENIIRYCARPFMKCISFGSDEDVYTRGNTILSAVVQTEILISFSILSKFSTRPWFMYSNHFKTEEDPSNFKRDGERPTSVPFPLQNWGFKTHKWPFIF